MPLFRTEDDISIAHDVAGAGPPLLLLHGFPQTRALWDAVVPALARRFTVVTADLRGYGASSKPAPAPDQASYAFRAMAGDMVALRAHLGFPRFHVAGHDRGGRVAHRMALDAPARIDRLAVMDIVPTRHLLENWSAPVATAYFHWTFLAQPAPLPERMIGADPDLFFESCLLGWGGAALPDFAALDAYRAAWRDPATVAGMVADYRATLVADLAHDRADAGRRVAAPTLVLYGADGAMARHFDLAAAWSGYLEDMAVAALPGGHFFVDRFPDETAAALARHFSP